MVTDESIKRRIEAWARKVGRTTAQTKLMRTGVSETMARQLVAGRYNHSITLEKAAQIERAIR